jgi:flagellar assembly protein FliH
MSSSKIIKSTHIPSNDLGHVASNSVLKKGKNSVREGFRKNFWIKASYLESDDGYLEADKEIAREIVDQAKAKAQTIEKEAYQEAYDKGFVQGEKAGTEVATRKFQSALDALDQAKKEFDRLVSEALSRSEAELVQLCLAVCKKVLTIEIAENRDVVVGAIKVGLQSIQDTSSVKIMIHPTNLERVQQCLDEIMAAKDGLKGVVFEGDERIGKGDALIETSYGNVDSRVAMKMEEIVSQFLQSLHEKQRLS